MEKLIQQAMVVRFALSLFLTHLAHECRTVHPRLYTMMGIPWCRLAFSPAKIALCGAEGAVHTTYAMEQQDTFASNNMAGAPEISLENIGTRLKDRTNGLEEATAQLCSRGAELRALEDKVSQKKKNDNNKKMWAAFIERIVESKSKLEEDLSDVQDCKDD